MYITFLAVATVKWRSISHSDTNVVATTQGWDHSISCLIVKLWYDLNRSCHPFTYKCLFGSYFSVFKLLFTLRTSASAVAPTDPTPFDSRLWQNYSKNINKTVSNYHTRHH